MPAPSSAGLSISLNAPAGVPALPAAVEVAAYRIITEALTNVVRHAHAHQVAIAIAVDGDLWLSVNDDGAVRTANGDGWRPGLGLQSMVERAAELGGTLQAGPTQTGGRVEARLRAGAAMTIRVLVADDHPLVRSGLQAALAPLPDVDVVAEAATGSAAVREAVLHRPDVVVMDLQSKPSASSAGSSPRRRCWS